MVSEVRLYFEGGGNQSHGLTQMREGMQHFLRSIKSLCQKRTPELRFAVLPCGGITETIKLFCFDRARRPDWLCLLLTDSDGKVGCPPIDHLCAAYPKSALPAIATHVTDHCHLMVHVMESWLLGDPQAVADHLGCDPGLLAEVIDLADVEVLTEKRAEHLLDQAAKAGGATKYHKLNHGAALLRAVDPERVKARAPHCRRLFDTMTTLISRLP